mgnify:CR=1 FL=1
MPNENTMKKTFTDNLNRLLRERAITQAELATYMEVSNTTVNNWVKGYKVPRMDKVDKLCSFFKIKRSELLEQAPAPASDDLPDLTPKDEREIMHLMDDMKEKLMQEEGLMFDGQPASPESIQSILDAMQIGMEMRRNATRQSTHRRSTVTRTDR